jgi:hypothetical protein
MVGALQRAALYELKGNPKPEPVESTKVDVQFNPTSMRLQYSNSVDKGKVSERHPPSFNAVGPVVLSFDLVFDTADEKGQDVRARSEPVRKFLIPRGEKGEKQAPPRIRFHWGKFIFDGVMTSASEDLDLFAEDGTPLRSKVSVSLTAQDPQLAALAKGPGAARGRDARSPDAEPAGPGSQAGEGAVTRPAVGGESAAQFAARQGLDPSAWRGLQGVQASPLALPAGTEIGFSDGLTAAPGLGARPGVEAGVAASAEAAFGLAPAPGTGAADGGMTLAAAGGVGPAIDAVKQLRSASAADETRRAFDAPGARGPSLAGPASRPSAPAQPRPPLRSQRAQPPAVPAPRPPRPDPRSTAYGFGVPLRRRVGQAATARAARLGGWLELRPRTDSPEPPSTLDPTTAPWVALRAARGRR